MKRYEVSGFGVMEYEEVASTNSLAEKLPLSELKDKQVILTWRQTQGRGQATNRWESAPGKNISMTVIFRPERLEAGKQFAVSMVIALGCLDFLPDPIDEVAALLCLELDALRVFVERLIELFIGLARLILNEIIHKHEAAVRRKVIE